MKENANPVTPVEKNQEICGQLVKRKIKPTVNAAMLQLQECSTRVGMRLPDDPLWWEFWLAI